MSNKPVSPQRNKERKEKAPKNGILEPAEEEDESEAKRRKRVEEEVAEGRDRRAVKSQSVVDDQDGVNKESEEARPVTGPPIPPTPSKEDVARHRLTHRPYRSWCPHCIRGKGRADRHMQSNQKHDRSDIPKLASDYFFIGRRRAPDRAERERKTKKRPRRMAKLR